MMESIDEQTASVFKICGIEMSFDGVELPELITVSHEVPEHLKHFAKDRENGSDVEVHMKGETLLGHRELLSSRIPYFNSLFNSEMIESHGKINLSNEFCEFGLITINKLLDYAYTGQLTISTTNVQDLIIGAQFLGMVAVVNECAEFMRRRLTIDNILSIFSLCKTIGCHEIYYHLQNFFDTNFVPLSLTPQFLELQIEELEEFMRRDSLDVDEEEQVFAAANRWIEYEPERRKYAKRVLKCVRCKHISISYITETIEKSEWVMKNSDCVALINKAKEFIINKVIQNGLNTIKNSKRVCEHAHILFLSIKCPYLEDDSSEKYLQLYDPHTNTWTNLKSEGVRHGENIFVYTNKHKLHHCLPSSSENTANDWEIVQVYDTITNQWHFDKNSITQNVSLVWPVRASPTGRTAEIYGKFYGIGGDVDGIAVPNLITYNETTKDWLNLTPMASPRANPICAVVNEILYVFGGLLNFNHRGEEALRSGEKYDPETNSWSPISPMKNKRAAGAAVVLNGQVYVMGGEARYEEILCEMERYDAASDTWTSLKSMNLQRAFHDAYYSCGKIYVFGGLVAPKEDTNSVEMYDPLTDTWEYREPKISKRSICLPLSLPAHLPSPVPNLEGAYINGFTNFHLKNFHLLRALREIGFEQAYRAQSNCLRPAMLGNDIHCQAQEGAGKAALLVLATLQQLEIIDGELSILVLCFSRENAHKIKEEYERLSKYLPVKTAISLGGVSADKDKASFENDQPHILIGTPLRISNLIQAGALKLDKIKCLAIYDGDRILQKRDGRQSIGKIMESLPEKQILLFSRTRTEQLRNFCNNYMRKTPQFYEFREE